MIPQGYPLIAQGTDGEQWLVVGWTYGEDPASGAVAPIAVPLVGVGDARRLLGAITYSLPAVAKS